MSGVDQSYHGYATESDYHEHYSLLGLLEGEQDAGEHSSTLDRIKEILDRRTHIEIRTSGKFVEHQPRSQCSMHYPCGHTRTPENTKKHGNGFACRTCRQRSERASQAKRRARIKEAMMKNKFDGSEQGEG